MTNLAFHKATKTQARARVALSGPSGSGKTYTALTIASGLGERIALIDTEHGSASKYAGIFQFDTLELDRFDPRTFVQAIQAAEQAGYDVLVIDSMSHEWEGVGGVLELHDRATAEDKNRNSFAAWRKVTPLHNAFIEAIIAARMHVIGTMRSKSEYAIEGKTVNKVGTAPKQRDGVEYEFDVVADLELDNTMRVTKSRCPALHRATFTPAGAEVAQTLKVWLTDGAPALKVQPEESGPTVDLGKGTQSARATSPTREPGDQAAPASAPTLVPEGVTDIDAADYLAGHPMFKGYFAKAKTPDELVEMMHSLEGAMRRQAVVTLRRSEIAQPKAEVTPIRPGDSAQKALEEPEPA